MSLLRRIRGEVAGAWRSVGYDLGRRPSEAEPAEIRELDVTSTGMNTFPGALVDLPSSPLRTDATPPRRFVAVTVFCLLAMSGATGSYFVATSIFSAPTGNVAESAESAPQAAAERPIPVDQAAGGEAGMGSALRPAGKPRTTPPSASPTVAGAAGTVGTAGAAGPQKPVAKVTRGVPADAAAPATSRQERPTTVAPERTRITESPCDCMTPPVPTPTAQPVGTSPSASVRPSEKPDNSTSPAPSGSVGPAPSDAGDGHHRRRAHRN
ncbi:hypothetical protein FB565_001365 [Actinoplanes lutulentus]|uniref:Uncharacterized protein n=1 Tax=Actinoplanes lutulentus TaxID=1287878 RepID=A0A327ZM40_9ACTN|nr:hypothetical protein [Actinoplanes lutulentus]MBB2941661.1 hypothetical protein [Actinoplanes lutulentus]RAK39581.1 hypothetical protein B0I29_104118 [Actinoplanes lutulentus]